jgi:hypothetical protein
MSSATRARSLDPTSPSYNVTMEYVREPSSAPCGALSAGNRPHAATKGIAQKIELISFIYPIPLFILPVRM